jgi:hypothetical protein
MQQVGKNDFLPKDPLKRPKSPKHFPIPKVTIIVTIHRKTPEPY